MLHVLTYVPVNVKQYLIFTQYRKIKKFLLHAFVYCVLSLVFLLVGVQNPWYTISAYAPVSECSLTGISSSFFDIFKRRILTYTTVGKAHIPLYSATFIVGVFFSSPEPKAHGELL